MPMRGLKKKNIPLRVDGKGELKSYREYNQCTQKRPHCVKPDNLTEEVPITITFSKKNDLPESCYASIDELLMKIIKFLCFRKSHQADLLEPDFRKNRLFSKYNPLIINSHFIDFSKMSF